MNIAAETQLAGRLTYTVAPKTESMKTGWAADCISFDWVFYEGWNFNSGNYLFTTDTK